MDKITKTDIERLAIEIKAFLRVHEIEDVVSIYYNGDVERSENRNGTYIWTKECSVNPHDYFEYAAYDHILSMSFDGGLYELLNYWGGNKLEKFMKIFEEYGLYYELGNAWNLTCYLIDDKTEVEYTHYQEPKKAIYLYRTSAIPSEIQNIMNMWYDISEKVGDGGSCVLGAGFNFEWKGDKYFMPAQSPWQGSLSWEKHKDTIRQALENIGATEINYVWGRMD